MFETIFSMVIDFNDPKTYALLLLGGVAFWALPSKMQRIAKYATKLEFVALIIAMFLAANITLVLAKKDWIPGYHIEMNVQPTSAATR